jgi:hypothetical protein
VVSLWLTDTFKPFDFSGIAGYHHEFPFSLEKFPTLHGDNVIGARENWDVFM